MYGDLCLLFSVVVDRGVAGSTSVQYQSPRTSVVLESTLPVGFLVSLTVLGVAMSPPDNVLRSFLPRGEFDRTIRDSRSSSAMVGAATGEGGGDVGTGAGCRGGGSA